MNNSHYSIAFFNHWRLPLSVHIYIILSCQLAVGRFNFMNMGHSGLNFRSKKYKEITLLTLSSIHHMIFYLIHSIHSKTHDSWLRRKWVGSSIKINNFSWECELLKNLV